MTSIIQAKCKIDSAIGLRVSVKHKKSKKEFYFYELLKTIIKKNENFLRKDSAASGAQRNYQ